MSLTLQKPREGSIDSDRRHLMTASRPASIMSTMTRETITADDSVSVHSRVTFSEAAPTVHHLSGPAPPATAAYRGFGSKDAYFAALEEFAREKGHFKVESQMIGFYGEKTMVDYMREKDRVKLEAKEQARRDRRSSVKGAPLKQTMSQVAEAEETETERGDGLKTQSGRKMSWAMLGRRTSRGA